MLAIGVTMSVIIIVLYLFSRNRTRWNIQACPYEVIGEDETGNSIVVSDQGVERLVELMFTFDYGNKAEKRCYVIEAPEAEEVRSCFVFWRKNPDGEFNCTLDEELRRLVQKVFDGTARFDKKRSGA